MKRIGLLSVAFATVLAVACGGNSRRDEANNNPANDTAVGTAGKADTNRDARDVSSAARSWFEDRVKDNIAEIKLGELAGQQAQLADVKAFGRQMVQDHTQANDELTQVGSQFNVVAPTDTDDKRRDKMNDLAKKQGTEFDRDYMDTMVDEHEHTLKALEDRVDKEGDRDNPSYAPKKTDNAFEARLNEWAAKTAPTVRMHLDKARQIKDTLGRRTTDNNR